MIHDVIKYINYSMNLKIIFFLINRIGSSTNMYVRFRFRSKDPVVGWDMIVSHELKK